MSLEVQQQELQPVIYFAQAEGTDLIKIGFTAGTPAKRVADLQTGCPHKLSLLAVIEGAEADEQKWHREFESNWVNGEWFKLTPRLMTRMILAAAGDRSDFANRIGTLERSLAHIEGVLRSLGQNPRPQSKTQSPGDLLDSIAEEDPELGFRICTAEEVFPRRVAGEVIRRTLILKFPESLRLTAERWAVPDQIKRIIDALDQKNPKFSHRIVIDVDTQNGILRIADA